MPLKDKKKSSGGEKPLTSFFARAPPKSKSSPVKPTPTPKKPSVASSVAQSTSSSSDSPSMQLPSTPVRKASRKRSRSPESHPLVDLAAVTPIRPNNKKVRLSPRLNTSNKATSMIPSSQSDEEELPSATSIIEDSRSSSKQSSLSKSSSSPFSNRGTSPLPSSHVSPALSSSSKQSLECLDMPETPVALDATAKTARLIEQIKQRAFAAVHSSPEPTVPEFLEDLDDESDEEDVPFAMPVIPRLNLSKTEPEPEADTSVRYSLRKRNPSPNRLIQSTPVLPPARKKANPFDLLVKEKKAADKKGLGSEDLKRAHAIVKEMAHFNPMSDDDESDDEALQGTDALDLAIKSKSLFQVKPRRKRGSSSDDEEVRDTGKEIVGILARDVAIKQEDAQLQKPHGIHLWREERESSMEVDSVPPIYQLPSSDDLGTTINSYLKKNDGDQGRISTLLRVDFITATPMHDLPQTFKSVLDWELASKGLCIDGSMQNTVEWLAAHCMPIFSFSEMLSVLRELGAESDVLAAQKWDIPSGGAVGTISPEEREDALFRLIDALGHFAKNKHLALDELPEFVIALLLVALDESTSPENQQDAIHVINLICNVTEAHHSKELALCSRILTFVSDLQPSIQCNVVLFLAQGSGVTRRLANYTAYCVITDQFTVDPTTYSDKPPIEEIRRQFRKSPDCRTKFVIREETDYVDLGFYVTILGVAVSDIRGYVNQERQDAKKAPAEVDNTAAKPVVGLKALRDDLEGLHSKISDARATHLERSRTKGCIKALSMNLHYQRDLWTKNDAENKAKTLAQYFRKK